VKGLRLTDLYPSVQGEGPRTGVMTTFIRFGGCNMRCPLWPCDTQYAIQPAQWKNDPIVTAEEILDSLGRNFPPTKNICITGGEPTMQPEAELATLATTLLSRYNTIDLFTNGSLKPLPKWIEYAHVSVILDWKLPGSGEADTNVDIRRENVWRLTAKDMVKFVISDMDDFNKAEKIWVTLSQHTPAKFSAGVAWGKMRERDLLNHILIRELPWMLNVQVHKYIFSPEERQI
jgi:7-carboxy-7-deazaguanine synthase